MPVASQASHSVNQSAKQDVPCILVFGEWQAVKPACFKAIEARFPGLREEEITMFHGDETSESLVLEALKTRDLFNPRRIVIYQEPDFLQPKAKMPDMAAKLASALRDNRRGKAVNMLAGLLKEHSVSFAEFREQRLAVLKRLPLPSQVDLDLVMEVADASMERLEHLLGMEKKSGGSLLLDWISSARAQADLFLVIHMERPDRRNRLLKQFMKLCPVIDLTGRGGKSASLQHYVDECLSESGKTMDRAAMKLFMDTVGDASLSALKNEAEKLVSQSGTKKRITVDDVRHIVVRHREEEIFRITDAIRRRDVAGAVMSLRRLVSQGIHPLAVLSAVRNLLLRTLAMKIAVERLGLTGRARNMNYNIFKKDCWDNLKAVFEPHGNNPLEGLHPYAAWLSLGAVSSFSRQELLSMIGKMASLDFELKGGKIPPDLAIELFVMENLWK